MSATIYNQLLTDIQLYIKAQYKLLQVRSIEQTSQLLGLIIALFSITTIVVVGLIFLAIALAAWLEQWLPMWASYLVIAGVMLLIAMVVYWGKRWWFVRPVEKHLSEVIMEDTKPLVQQKQLLESQSAVQYELLQRDVKTIRQEWSYVESILQVIKNMMS